MEFGLFEGKGFVMLKVLQRPGDMAQSIMTNVVTEAPALQPHPAQLTPKGLSSSYR